jgi:flagellar hook-basal body complex protein FliE
MIIQPSFASQLYESARRIAPAETSVAGRSGAAETGATDKGTAFADALAAMAGSMSQSLEAGEAAARQAMAGQGDVQAVVEALTAAELALDTAVTVRDRVVEAYQEILRMPI